MNTQITVYGNMEWFDITEQPDNPADLPADFSIAYELWKQSPENNFREIARLLQPYLVAYFIPHNIRGSEGLFENPDGDELGEVQAQQIQLVGIDFTSYPVPLANAEALFVVPVKKAFFEIENLDDWQNENDLFVSGVVFGWHIPGIDTDTMFGDHQGAECILPYEGTLPTEAAS
jgi:hypothetical protein